MVADPAAGRPVASGLTQQGAVEVRRSTRRRRTVSAYREAGRTVVLLPARMSQTEEQRWITLMLDRLDAQERRRRPSDEALLHRARELSQRYLRARAMPSSVRWVDNQNTRWGSCTPVDATIRLSSRLRGMPTYVVDYVLLHELAHLLEPGHGPRFWTLLSGYPRTERARGYLEGVAGAEGLGAGQDADVDPVAETSLQAGDGPGVADDPGTPTADPTGGVGPDRPPGPAGHCPPENAAVPRSRSAPGRQGAEPAGNTALSARNSAAEGARGRSSTAQGTAPARPGGGAGTPVGEAADPSGRPAGDPARSGPAASGTASPGRRGPGRPRTTVDAPGRRCSRGRTE